MEPWGFILITAYMSKVYTYSIGFLFVSILMIAGCDNSFDPKSEFKEQLVVYAILTKSQSEQVVRLESTYDAELTNPKNAKEKRIISDADVYISDGRAEYKFEKRTITGSDGREKYVWVNSEMIPTEIRNYKMRIVSNKKTLATAEMQVPSRPYLVMNLQSPGSGLTGGVLVRAGSVSAAAPPKGFYFRLYVTGEAVIGSETTIVREEVPYAYNPEVAANEGYVFPSPSRNSEIVFPPDYVNRVKDHLLSTYGAQNLRLVAIGISMDANFYNYYKVVRGFDDPVSVRQDMPNITNISGGLGVFGAMTIDTVQKAYSEVIH